MISVAHLGIKVRLHREEATRRYYDIDAFNPVVGSSWECEGLVTAVEDHIEPTLEGVLRAIGNRGNNKDYDDENKVNVEWDNKHTNIYVRGDLEFIEFTGHNVNQRFDSIW